MAFDDSAAGSGRSRTFWSPLSSANASPRPSAAFRLSFRPNVVTTAGQMRGPYREPAFEHFLYLVIELKGTGFAASTIAGDMPNELSPKVGDGLIF